jgi:hypothetical protein
MKLMPLEAARACAPKGSGGHPKVIRDHASPGSEASQVVQNFSALSEEAQQDLINFLRAL